jgi:hypothetical protein
MLGRVTVASEETPENSRCDGMMKNKLVKVALHLGGCPMQRRIYRAAQRYLVAKFSRWQSSEGGYVVCNTPGGKGVFDSGCS